MPSRSRGCLNFWWYDLERNFHVVDVGAADASVPLYKVKPFADRLIERFQEVWFPGEHIAIDEASIRSKHRSSLIRFNKNKPAKFHYKAWVAADEYTWVPYFKLDDGLDVERPRPSERESRNSLGTDFEVPSGNITFNIIMHIVDQLPQNRPHYVFVDNFYASADLLEELSRKNVRATMTFKKRSGGFPKEIKNTKLKERGQSDFMTRNGRIAAGVWVDKKKVFVATNSGDFSRAEPVKRRLKDGTQSIYSCPMAVREYQDHYGYVDRVGQQLGYYATYRYSKHPWHPLFFWLWDLTLHQAYLLYKAKNNWEEHGLLSWRAFLLDIAESLIGGLKFRQRNRKRSKVESCAQESNGRVPHSPSFGHSQNRCAVKGCGKKSTLRCEECNICLCQTHVVEKAWHPKMQGTKSP